MERLVRRTTRPKVISAVILVICIVGALLYVGRGWVRQSVVPFYAKIVYLHQVRNHFDKDFKPIDLTMSKIGYHFNTTDDDECSNPFFQGFGESINCAKGITSNKLTPSTDLTKKWKQTAPNLERRLLISGWTKDNVDQPIVTLLDNTNVEDTSQPAVNYRRYHGKVECNFSMRNSPSSHETYATEYCQRNVSFFGGY